MYPFWQRKYCEIKDNGWAAVKSLIKYTWNVKHWIPGMIIAIPLVLIVRLIRPFIWIRFGNINAGRIGHFTYDVEYYLCEKEIGMHKGKHDIFFFGREPANFQFVKMCKRKLTIRSFAQYLWRTNDIIPGGSKHVVTLATRSNDYRDALGLFDKTKPHLPFTSEEDERGRQFLMQHGCSFHDKFVCLMVRDSAYLSRDYSYHDYRDADVEDFEKAILSIAKKGYFVFRMGKTVHKPLKIKHPRILDYANTPCRNDFLDIWLMANCFFCISTSAGLDSVCMVYRRPVAYVNFDVFNQMILHQHSVVAPKHYYWRDSGRHLTFEECIKHSYMRTEEYLKDGIAIKNLNREEVTETVLELEARLNGNWVDRVEDQILQRHFLEQYKARPDFNKYNGWINPEFRIGAHFLRCNKNLLKYYKNSNLPGGVSYDSRVSDSLVVQ